MKKLLSIIAALLICMGTQAQIVSSRSSIVRTENNQVTHSGLYVVV